VLTILGPLVNLVAGLINLTLPREQRGEPYDNDGEK
jgi:hypothetical protein